MQQPGFGDNSRANTVLQVSASKKQLSKNQQTFNRLTKRIAKLRNALETDGTKLRQLRGIYNAEITPLMHGMANAKIALAKKLGYAFTNISLTPKQTDELGRLIFDLLDDAFALVTPDAEAKKLYDSLAITSYDDTRKEDSETAKENIREHLSDIFGIDVNMDDFGDDPDGFAQFEEKLRQRMEERQQQEKNKKKSKKQLAKEASLLEQEAVKKRSMRSIYMSLVKLLHPDTEPDETVRLQKEEIMKELTRAYNDHDLTKLLQLELQWIARENDHLEKLNDDTLKVYIGVLNGQVKELEMEMAMQAGNPAFAAVSHYINMNLEAAIRSIHFEKRSLEGIIEQMKDHTSALEGGGKLRAVIRDCLRAYSTVHASPYDDDSNQQSFNDLMEILMRRNR